MILIIITLLVFIAGYLLYNYKEYDYEISGVFTMIFSGFILILMVVSIPINRMETKAEIKQFKSIQLTIQKARKNNNDKIENAAFQMKIADNNSWLAGISYWNTTVFDIWIPDEIENLKPIE